MRSRYIQNDILNYLLDYRKHTLTDIANELNISRITAQRHIADLSLHYPISIIHGGRENGGIRLEKNFVIGNSNITNDELHIIVKSLLLMQSKGTDCSSLIKKLASNSLLKEIEDESFNEERKWAL